jgi:hypothetical protein
MKYLLAIMVILSTNVMASEIKNGIYSIEVGGRVDTFGSCSSFTDGRVVGIVNEINEPFKFAHELEADSSVNLSNDSYTTSLKTGAISAKGFCSSQELLSSIKMTYSKTARNVSMSYKYRCNRKVVTKVFNCTQI